MKIFDTKLNILIDGEDYYIMKIIDEYLEFLYGEQDKVKKKTNVAGAVIIKKGENNETMILLIQRSKSDNWPNFWEIPRGGVKENAHNDHDGRS